MLVVLQRWSNLFSYKKERLMDFTKIKQKDCPYCIDLSLMAKGGETRQVFDICKGHLTVGVLENEKDFKDIPDFEV